MGDVERHTLLWEWSRSADLDPGPGCLHELFEAQAGRSPDALAVSWRGHGLSYGELGRRADALARRLAGLGVGPESRVGLCVERSLDLVVALLAILKAGGAYVPLDPAYPQERLAYMLRDASRGVKRPVLVTQRPLLSRLGDLTDLALEAVLLDEPAPGTLSGLPPAWRRAGPENVAYVIYTSGSTGAPKGVAIEHHSAIALVRWAIGRFSPQELAGVLFSTSICFDISVFEFFVTLGAGGTLVLVDNALELATLPDAERVTLIHSVPSAMSELLRMGGVPGSVRAVGLGGEALTGALVDQVYERTPARRVVNLYGPTEDSIWSTSSEVPRQRDGEPSLGRPVSNGTVYLLDRELQPVPVGTPGEVFLGGEGVSRGYLHRPGLTAEKFVPDPFGGKGGRLYRVGDLARYRPDGQLEFLGRVDHQVKVRGFRIEVGEIEACLARHPALRESVVAAREASSGELRLVAYVVPGEADGGPAPVVGELRAFLGERLPAHMVPSAYVFLRSLPRLPNGKVDRSALPAPSRERPRLAVPYEPAATHGEMVLEEIWAAQLGLDQVGRHDPLLELGADSLLVTQLVSRIRDRLGVALGLPDIFAHPTLAELARHIDAAQAAGETGGLERIEAEAGGEIPLALPQEQVWFMCQVNKENLAYHFQATLRLRGALDVRALERSLSAVIERHEVFRTTFPEVDGRPVQKVHPPFPVHLRVVDCQGPDGEAEAWRWIAREIRQPIDVARLPLARWVLLRLAEKDHILLHIEHHLVHDGWSFHVFLRDLLEYYRAFTTASPVRLPEPSIQFADFARWQHRWLESPAAQDQLAYWLAKLAGVPPTLELPTDRPRPKVPSFQGAAPRFTLPPALCERLRELARPEGATFFMAQYTAFLTLMRRYSGQHDFAVGTGVANRRWRETEDLLGMIVNVVALRTDLSGRPTLRELMRRVRAVALEAYAHQDLPLEAVVKGMKLERDASRNPLFQVLFNFHDAPLPESRLSGLSVEVRPVISNRSSKFDFNVILIPRLERPIGEPPSPEGEGATIVWEHSSDLFDLSTVERMFGHFRNLLTALVDDPDRTLLDAPMLDPEERLQIEREWGMGPEADRWERPAPALIEEQARMHPEAVAVQHRDECLRYGELDAWASRTAGWLHAHGVGPEDRVAFLGDRGLGMLATTLGVLKAGAAFVPLDPESPDARLLAILEDSGAAWIATGGRHAGRAARLADQFAAGLSVFCWDRDALASGPTASPEAQVEERSLANIFYTSGSTGTPKGAMVEHRGMLNHLLAKVRQLGLDAGSVVAQNASCSFDISVWQSLAPLVAGGRTVIYDTQTALDPAALLAAVERDGVTVLETVPTLLEAMVAIPPGDAPRLARLRFLISNAEALPVPLARRWLERFPHVSLLNTYGATECSDDTTHWVMTGPPAAESPRVPVGSAIPGLRLYVLDKELGPVPATAPGQIAMAGVGVGRGYLNDPARTARTFVPDPFADSPGGRLYLTGDLGRWSRDGRLEVLGRLDHQVKVRGHRVELGEIEAAAARHPAVRQAVVMVRPNRRGQDRLVVYVVTDGTLREDGLRTHLQGLLPPTMVPEAFVELAAMPLTAHGKIDRRALPDPGEPVRSVEYVAPRNDVEAALAEVWQEVLGVERAGLGDNFFALGGHSLRAVQVCARLRQRLQVEVPVVLLFEHPVLEDLAREVMSLLLKALTSLMGKRDNSTQTPAGAPEAGRRDGIPRIPDAPSYPLSRSQQGLWFLHRVDPENTFYNLVFPCVLDGPVDRTALAWALDALTGRHAGLRTTFGWSDDGQETEEPTQRILSGFSPQLASEDLAGLEEREQLCRLKALVAETANTPFDLEAAPPVRALLVRLADERHLFVLVLHHLISDGWSEQILFDDLWRFYEAERDGRAARLPELPIRYVDYAAWQSRRLESGELAAAESWWLERLSGALPDLALPVDHPPIAAGPRLGLHTERFTLTPAEADRLRRLADAGGATLFMVQLALVTAFLARITGQDDLRVGIPVAGREHPDTEGVVGFFVNALVLRTDLAGDPSLLELVEKVRRVALDAFAHQEVPFDLLVERLNPARDLAATPLFQVFFGAEPVPRRPRLPGLQVRSALEALGDDLVPRSDPRRADRVDFRLGYREEEDGGLSWLLLLNGNRFEPQTARRLARQLASLIRSALDGPRARLSELALLTAAEQRELAVRRFPPRHDYPLLASQRDLWLQCQLDPDTPYYNLCQSVLLRGPLHHGRLERALGIALNRHEGLRVRFLLVDGRLVQRVEESVPVVLHEADLAGLDPEARGVEVKAYEETLGHIALNLERGPLFLFGIARLDREEHRLVAIGHHIALDGMQLNRLVTEALQIYERLGKGLGLPDPVPVHGTDFALWQQAYLESGDWYGHRAYWRERIAGALPGLELRTDRRRPARRSFRSVQVDRLLPEGLVRRLEALRTELDTTLLRTLLAGYVVLLGRLSGKEDILFSMPMACAPKGLEEVRGYVSNFQPVRFDVGGEPTVHELVRRVDTALREALAHAQYPIAEVLRTLGDLGEKETGRLFPLCVSQTRSIEGRFGELEAVDSDVYMPDVMFDLLLLVRRVGGQAHLSFRFSPDLFDTATIEHLATCLETLLADMVEHPGKCVPELDPFTPAERQQVLSTLASGGEAPACGLSAPALFARRAAEHPERPAVVCAGGTLTYRELDARSDEVARWLRARGAGRESRVGLFGERGAGMLAALLGTLKAGAAFVPLDPEHPDTRLGTLLETSGISFLATQQSFLARAMSLATTAPAYPQVLCWDEALDERGPDGPGPEIGPRDLANVFFTSGSTGLPKGAMIEHGGMLNHLLAKIGLLGLDDSSVVAQNASHCFDISVWQSLAPLLAGGRVVVYDRETALDAPRFLHALDGDGVTVLETVPTLLETMLDAVESENGHGHSRLRSLRHLISNAEALPAPLAARWMRRFPAMALVNTYGATECSDDTTHALVEAPSPAALRVPVGASIPGLRHYVLDHELRPVPVGFPGQIVMAGVGVGRGYLAAPDQTAAAFVPDPFGGPGERLYLSGDLGRWTYTGVLEVLGRLDFQTKVRGHRVEPGEIEAALAAHPAVRQAAVVAHPDRQGRNRLVGYAVPNGPLEADALRAHLEGLLPAYMVPEQLVFLAQMPLTRNGKVDRGSLPEPGEAAAPQGSIAPRNDMEAAVAAVWQEVLGLEQVGVADDFFALGGHSLKAVQLSLRLRQACGTEVPVRLVFENPTVAGQAQALAAWLGDRAGEDAGREAVIPRAPEREWYPLSHAQRGLWFLQRVRPDDTFFNAALPLLLEGALDRPALERAWLGLVRRHEALRTAFAEGEEGPVQRILPTGSEGEPALAFHDLAGLPEAAREARLAELAESVIQPPFDLALPPVRALLIALAADRHLLLLVLHHILADPESSRILAADLAALYAAERGERDRELPPPPVRYVDHAEAESRRLDQGLLAEAESWWIERLGRDLPPLDLPADHPAPARPRNGLHRIVLRLDSGWAERLRRIGQERRASPFMARLALFASFLSRVSGQEELRIGVPASRREHADLQGVVGLFVNTLVLDLDLAGNPTIPELVERVRHATLEAFSRQEVPYERLLERLSPARTQRRSPFQAFFVDMPGAAPAAPAASGGLQVRLAPELLAAAGRADLDLSGRVDLRAGVLDEEGEHGLVLYFNADRFEPSTCRRLAGQLEALLRFAVEHPEARLSELPLLSAAEQQDLALRRLPPREDYPLSFTQSDMWLQAELHPESPFFHLCQAIDLRGELAPWTVRRALVSLLSRYEGLRVVFAARAGRPVQRVLPEAKPVLRVADFSALPTGAWAEALETWERRVVEEPFDPAAGPCVRLGLARLGNDEHRLLVVVHHLVIDAVHLMGLAGELLQLCDDPGREPPPPPAVHYPDFAAWQEARREAGLLHPHRVYWRGRLRGALPATELPTDRPRPAARTYASAEVVRRLPAALADRIEGLQREVGASWFRLQLAAFVALLSHLEGRDQVLIAMPVGQRPPEMDGAPGFFANTLPLAVDLSGGLSGTGLVARVSRAVAGAVHHGDYPLFDIVAGMEVEREPGKPLFPVCASQFRPFAPDLRRLAVQADEIYLPGSLFDLWALIRKTGSGFTLTFKYGRELFDQVTVERLAGRLETLLAGLTADPGTPISELEVLPPAEREQVLGAWNTTERPYPRERTLHDLFEERAGLCPEAEAITFGDRRLTYAELDREANRLAHWLLAHGTGRDRLVALYLERSPEMIVALLGVLKAGAAYAPLEVGGPPLRLRQILDQVAAPVLLTQEALLPDLAAAGFGGEVLCLDRDAAVLAEEPSSRPGRPASADQLAYVNFTSGSTGQPKGVVVPHRGVVRLVQNPDYIEFLPGDAVLQVSTYAWDAATFEVWGALLNGCRLVLIARDDVLDFPRLRSILAEERITVLYLTTALFNRVIDSAPEALAGLRVLIVGGETASVPHFRKAAERLPATVLINEYGPTENTSFSSWQRVDAVPPDLPALPIGVPLANSTVYVLDRELRPAPVGIAGELFLGGDGLARGYLGRPDLTAGRFVPHPFAAGERLYRTGDLGRWRSDGRLDFLGRIDLQVKIRGHRIEPAEIEETLRRHPQVRDAAVTAFKARAGEMELCAYVVAREGSEPLSIEELRSFLARHLPEPMVPGRYVLLAALPLTATGKVDRKALPPPEAGRTLAAETAFLAPRNAMEETVARIWSEVLGTGRVGARDDFFVLGGHSLRTVQVCFRLQQELGVTIPLRLVFENPLLEDQARALGELLAAGSGESYAPIPRAPEAGAYPLSPAQRGIWFLHHLDPADAYFNAASPFLLAGSLDQPALEEALDALVRRHEALRTAFVAGQVPGQRIVDGFAPRLELHDLSALAGPERHGRLGELLAAAVHAPFDLREPPFRALLVRMEETQHVLALVLHHTISDARSGQVLFDDLWELYRAKARGEEPGLPPLPVRYVDYAVWYDRRLAAGALAEDERFWLERLGNLPPALELPADHPASNRPDGGSRLELLRVEPAVVQGLRAAGRARGATAFMTQLAACYDFLHGLAGEEDLAVGIPMAGRDHPDLEKLVGVFVNLVVLRTDLGGDPTFLEVVERVRRTAVDAYSHASFPFDLLVDRLHPDRDINRTPLFQVIFNEEPLSIDRSLHVEGLEVRSALELLAGLSRGRSASPNFARVDLELAYLEEENGGLTWVLYYKADRFEPATCRRWTGRLERLLRRVSEDPGLRLSALDPLAPAERGQLLSQPASGAGTERGAGESARPGFRGPRDEIELAVSMLWEEQLGAGPLSVLDDFFALGGNSLHAVSLTARIEARFGFSPPLRALLEAPTVAGFSRLIRDRLRGSDRSAVPARRLVTLQVGEPGMPRLFLVHPHGGSVFSYHPLVRALGPEWPVTGLQAPGLEEGEEPFTRIGEMAAAYCQEIRRLQPGGPYHLAGWSFGVPVAFEMARKLEKDGDEVAFLGMLDHVLEDSLYPYIEETGESEEEVLLSILAYDLYGRDEGQLQGLGEEELLRRVFQAQRERGIVPQDAEEAMLRRLYRVVRSHAMAHLHYRPSGPVRADVWLFQASEASNVPEPAVWSRWTQGQIRVVQAAGTHHTMVFPPGVYDIARGIREACGSLPVREPRILIEEESSR